MGNKETYYLLILAIFLLFIFYRPTSLGTPRKISKEELTKFTTTGNSGEIVMVGQFGILLDQGYQALNITPTDTIFYGGSTVNTERLRIQSSTGNIGIGTSNPSALLSVNGNAIITGPIGVNTSTIIGSSCINVASTLVNGFGVGSSTYDTNTFLVGSLGYGTGYGSLSFGYHAGNNTGYLGMSGMSRSYWNNLAYGALSHSFYTNNNVNTVGITTLPAPTLQLSSNGLVGIGITNPSDSLHVAGNILLGANPYTNSTVTSKIYGPAVNSYYGSTVGKVTGNSITLYAGDMQTQNWGNPNVGSSLYLRGGHLLDNSPFNTTPMPSAGNSSYQGGHVYIMSGSSCIQTSSPVLRTAVTAGDIIMTTGGATKATSIGSFVTADNERLRISGTTGYVGIGIVNPSAPLHVGSTASNLPPSGYYYFNSATIGIATTAQNTSIVASGWIQSAAGFLVYSDERIKKDVKPLEKCLELVDKLKPVQYGYRDYHNYGKNQVAGFIAQEVQQVYPEAVSIHKEFIPSIYKPYKVQRSAKGFTLTEPLPIPVQSTIRIVDSVNKRYDGMYVSEYELEFNAEDIQLYEDMLFIYGHEVSDHLSLHKESLFTVGMGAIQELYQLVKQQQKEIQELKNRL